MIGKVLTIAGSDCSGGAGIQADIKTIAVHKMYGMSVITALTAQNTQGVFAIEEISPAFVRKQIDCVFTDIVPDAVKIGMVASGEIIEAIAEKLKEYHARIIVLDPVMISTSGSRLLSENAVTAMKTALFPLASIITPNIPEAEVLSGRKIANRAQMAEAAKLIAALTKGAVLVKGGHLAADGPPMNAGHPARDGRANDLLIENGAETWFEGTRIGNPNTHGTGCTLSSAIACNLAGGLCVSESVGKAKDFLTGALRAGLDLGKGSGPLDHTYRI